MKRVVMAVLVMGCAAAVAHAEFTKGSQTIAVLGGFSGSSTEYDYQPGTREPVTGGGGALGGQYVYYFSQSPALGVGADIVGSANGDREDDDVLSNFDTRQRLKSTVGMVIARLAYPRGLFRPYIFGGLGAHSSTQKLYANPRGSWPGGGSEERMLIDEDKTSLAVGGGIGFDIFPTESFFMGIEVRGTWLEGLDTDDNAAIKNAGYNVDDKNGISQGNLLFRAGWKF